MWMTTMMRLKVDYLIKFDELSVSEHLISLFLGNFLTFFCNIPYATSESGVNKKILI